VRKFNLWMQGHLTDAEYQIFLQETMEKERSELMGASMIGSVIFLLWGIIDYFFAPDMWKEIVLYRCLILVPYNGYNALVARGVLPYQSLTKLVNSLPAAIYTAWIVAVVPENGFQFYSIALAILIMATGASRLWLSGEFFTYAGLLCVSCLSIWIATPTLTLFQEIFLGALIVTALFASFGSAITKHSLQARNYWQKWEQIRKDREILERRLAESAKAAFMAEHLGLFLHDIKNILYHLELMGEAVKVDQGQTLEILSTLDKANRFTRNRIEYFLAQIKTGKPRKEPISILEEIEAVEKISIYDVRYKKIRVSFDYGNLTKDSSLVAVRGALPSVIFNMIRNSICAIEKLRDENGAAKELEGIIKIIANTVDDDLLVSVDDNGATIGVGTLEAFNSGRLIESSAEAERAGLGTYAMRLETRALGGVIRMVPKEKETFGTIVHLKIPLSGGVVESMDIGGQNQGLFSTVDAG
jgi:hypothetical protein